MTLSLEITDRNLFILLSAIVVVSAIGIAIAQTTPNPGHTLSELAPGAFPSGNYIFPDDLDVQGDLDVAGSAGIGSIPNNLGIQGDIDVSGNSDITGNLVVGGEITGKINLVCPSGFTKIESQGRVLGCIQNTEEGSANYDSAVNDCFDTYGATLPSYAEITVAFNKYSLDKETDDREWTNSATGGASAAVIRDDGLSGSNGEGQTIAYRCWIPA